MLVVIYERFVFLRRQLRLARLRFNNWVDAFWGYDVFIAHRRADAADYAQSLYEKLGAEKVSCFIDRAVYGPGLSLRVATKRHVAKSTLFCLIGSPELLVARKPIDWVEQEIGSYLKTHRDDPKVLLIDFGGLVTAALNNTHADASVSRTMLNQLRPFLRQTEEIGALTRKPSPEVLATVRANITGRRRDRARLMFFQTTAAILLALLAATTALGGLAWSQKNLAQRETIRALKSEKQAQANEQWAKKNEQLANESERLAKLSKDEARRDLEIAKSGADDLAFRVASNIPRLKDKQEEAVLVILDSARALIEKLIEIAPSNLDVKKSQFLIWSQSIEHYLARRQFDMAKRAGESCLSMLALFSSLERSEINACRENAADAKLATGDATGAAAIYTDLHQSFLQDFSSAQADFDDFVQQAADMGLHVFSQDKRLKGEVGPAAYAAYKFDIKRGDASQASHEYDEALRFYDLAISQKEDDFSRVEDLEIDDLKMQAQLGSALSFLKKQEFASARSALTECIQTAGSAKWSEGGIPVEASRLLGQAFEELGDLDLKKNDMASAGQNYKQSALKRKEVASRDVSHLADQFALGKVLVKVGDTSDFATAFDSYFEGVKALEFVASNEADKEAKSEFRLALIKLIRAGRGEEKSESKGFMYLSEHFRKLDAEEPEENSWKLGYFISLYYGALTLEKGSWQQSDDLAKARELANHLNEKGQLPEQEKFWLKKIRDIPT